MELPEGTPSASVIAAMAAAFRARGVEAVVVRAPEVDAGPAGGAAAGDWRRHVDVVVPKAARAAADAAMAELDWRVAIGGLGAWRRVPTVTYHWEYSPNLAVHRGVPSAPLPSRASRALERSLFDRAQPSACGLRSPDAAVLAVFAATQAARPGTFRQLWLEDVAVHVAASSADEVHALASGLGLDAVVRWALDPATASVARSSAGPLYDAGIQNAAWRVALAARRHARPRRVGAWLGGIPKVGTSIVRSRFAGIELRAGPGAFTPQVVSEPMVGLALDALPEGRRGIAVDVGTGVGAVALAVASQASDVVVYGCDLSKDGLRWARRNRAELGLEGVTFLRGSLLEPLDPSLQGRVDVITANVPYVPSHVFGEGFSDPDAAVLGQGPDGLGLHRELLAWAAMFLKPGGRLVVQMAIDQWELFVPDLVSWSFAPQGITESSFEDAICWAIAG